MDTSVNKRRIEVVTFGAGCFWGAEAAFRKISGVVETLVGYSGGTTEHPTYEDVCSGTTGHAEVINVLFRPAGVSLEDLLEAFWMMHDPTTTDRQGSDIGAQYRSVIFYHSDDQRRLAETSKKEHDTSGRYSRPIVTEILPAPAFYPAEEYHQRYLEKLKKRHIVDKNSSEQERAEEREEEGHWRGVLSPEEHRILRERGTELPFSGEHVLTKEPGVYTCRACGNILFSSETKFDSGTGWPSFSDAAQRGSVSLVRDEREGMERTEVRCSRCGSHMGHVFDDGPGTLPSGKPGTGKRYCVNSLSLTFNPTKEGEE
jgi:peptide methionine sulfoxide reductase msrA/msrB